MPSLLEAMEARLGIQEIPGKRHNPVILKWMEDAGHPEFKSDETSWCSLCLCSAAKEADYPFPPINQNPMARSWLAMGVRVKIPDIEPGDVAVWPRGDPKGPMGHVNVVKEIRRTKNQTEVKCVGGNQGGLVGGDAVTITNWVNASGALDFRRLVPATVPALRAAGSTEIAKADNIQVAGGAMTVVSAIWAAVKELFGPVDVPQFLDLKEGLSWWQTIIGGANAVANLVAAHPWLAVTLLGGGVFILFGRQLKNARVVKHAMGVPLSAEVAQLGSA